MNNNKLTPPTEYSSSGYKFTLLEYSQLPPTKDAKLQRVKAIYVAQDTDKISNIEVLILKEGKFHHMSEEFRQSGDIETAGMLEHLNQLRNSYIPQLHKKMQEVGFSWWTDEKFPHMVKYVPPISSCE